MPLQRLYKNVIGVISFRYCMKQTILTGHVLDININNAAAASEIRDISFRGTITRVVLSVDNQFDNSEIKLAFEFSSNMQVPNIGELISLSFDPKNAIQLFQDQHQIF